MIRQEVAKHAVKDAKCAFSLTLAGHVKMDGINQGKGALRSAQKVNIWEEMGFSIINAKSAQRIV